MRDIFILAWRAIQAWWREFLYLLILNVVWLFAQATVILGPPTTAMFYGIAEKVIERELISAGDAWRLWRENFARAWVWGAPQLAVYGVLGFNLFAYAGREGVVPLALRYAWTLILFLWFAINLYYWPLNFAQADRRFSTTLANAAKMALLNPAFTMAYALLALALIIVSVLSGLLLGAVLGAWLALWGTLVVRALLSRARPGGPPAPPA